MMQNNASQFAQEGVQQVVMQVTGNNAQAAQAAGQAMQVVAQMAQNKSQGAPMMVVLVVV